jgi:ribonuclease BN (tRNA processing enzyme)
MMPEVAILGSGSGFATKDRFCTCIAVMAEPHLYLLDCGEPASALLRRAGIDVGALRALFVSHMHSDHIGGIPQLISAVSLPARGSVKKFKPWSVSSDDPWYRDGLNFPAEPVSAVPGIRRRVDVVMPEAGIAPVRNFLDAVFIAPDQLPFDLEFRPAAAGVAYMDEVVAVMSAPTGHLDANPSYARLPPERRQCFGYRLDLAGRALVFSADVDLPSDLAPLLHGKIDTLIMEVAHYDPTGLRDFLVPYDIGRVVLSHIHPGLEQRISELVRDWADDRFIIATDGMRFSLAPTANGTSS